MWGPSSAHYPQSNGQAEAAVKAAKNLVIKEAAAGDLNTDAFRQALLEFRNTPRACGRSLAEMLYGHQLRSIVSAHWSAFVSQWQNFIRAHDRQVEIDAATKAKYDESARQLPALHIGTKVRIHDHATKLWSHTGEIVRVGSKSGRPRSYQVKFTNGSLLWRNRRHLRPVRDASGEERRNGATTPTQTTSSPMESSPSSQPATGEMTPSDRAAERPRRSAESKKTPSRFNDFVLSRS